MSDDQDEAARLGWVVPGWKPVSIPPKTPMIGRCCRVEPMDLSRHAEALYLANGLDQDGVNWDYLPYGPFADLDGYRAWLKQTCLGADPMFHAIINLATERAVGVASLMRIDPMMGVIEVGHINYSPALQATIAGTEAMFLMMRRVFDELGYRRYEWKCNALNERSKNAAQRLGFTFEGVFRQASVSKRRNRDTAWFSILDREWPPTKAAFEEWLAHENFDDAGKQRASLGDLIRRHQQA